MDSAFFRYGEILSFDMLSFDLKNDVAMPYRVAAPAPNAFLGGSTIEPGPATAPAMDFRRFLTEMSYDVGTGCSGTEGNTFWPNINGFQHFIDRHHLPITFHTGSNPFGESGFRDDVIHTLQTTGAPGVIHTGFWSGHSEVVNAHYQCFVRDKSNGDVKWRGDHYFYLNAGWGGAHDRWEAIGNLMMSTTFTPNAIGLLRPKHAPSMCLSTNAGDLGAANQVACIDQTLSLDGFRYEAQIDGSFELVHVASGKCLTIDPQLAGFVTPNGTNVYQTTCTGANEQRWMITPNGDLSFSISPKIDGTMCLDVAGISTSPGARAWLWSCWGGDNQRWLLD
jgi:hypothetical protein